MRTYFNRPIWNLNEQVMVDVIYSSVEVDIYFSCSKHETKFIFGKLIQFCIENIFYLLNLELV